MDQVVKKYTESCKSLSIETHGYIFELLEGCLYAGKELTILNLRGSQKRLFNDRLTDPHVFALCEALYEYPSLNFLDLSYNNLKDASAQALARLLKMNSSLQLINLVGNEITSAGLAHIADVLSSTSSQLSGLLLSGNPLKDEGALLLAEMLKINSSLKVLDLANTMIGYVGIIGLCVALTDFNRTLEELDLEAPLLPNPQDSTIQALARMMKSSNSIKRLSLAKHGLVDDQFETLLVYGLLHNRSLTSLNLRCNKLSAFSAPHLERLLAECHHLTSLNLGYNRLGDGGALAVVRALPYTHWLARLDLRGNNIGEAGLTALAESLSLAIHLQLLLVWGNKFGPDSSRAFHDTLSQPTLMRLHIDIQPYEVDGVAAVALKDVKDEM